MTTGSKRWTVGQVAVLNGEEVKIVAKVGGGAYDVMNFKGQVTRVYVKSELGKQ